MLDRQRINALEKQYSTTYRNYVEAKTLAAALSDKLVLLEAGVYFDHEFVAKNAEGRQAEAIVLLSGVDTIAQQRRDLQEARYNEDVARMHLDVASKSIQLWIAAARESQNANTK